MMLLEIRHHFDFECVGKRISTLFKMWSNYADYPKKFFLISDKTSGLSGRAGSNDSDMAVSALCIISTLKGFDYKSAAEDP